MAMNTFDKGDTIRLTGTFKQLQPDGVTYALADPTTTTFRVEEPDGTKTVYIYPAAQVVRDSLGIYHVDWPIAKIGIHTWRMEGTGTVPEAEEQKFEVRNSRF